jgi:hypothetical protein
MDVNRISGYIPGKMVFFLMQARLLCPRCPAHGIPCCTSSALQTAYQQSGTPMDIAHVL